MGQACSNAVNDPRYDPHHPDFYEASMKATSTPEPSVAKNEPSSMKGSEVAPVAAPEPTPQQTPPTQYCVPCLR